ncbi:kinase-like protein [Russula earlei]|uniref:Kinase-like protein n=1 Tax=Russula earlei TaxID=71964 RepID=A0ACC0UDB2_9AGAM|nr:kinase-like protein [Russula earlei]
MSSNHLPRPPAVGTLIDNGNLELVSVLGYGGYGVVYRAIDVRSTVHNTSSYAVKCLLHTPTRNAVRQRRLHLQEITLHQLASTHPNVVTLHRVIEEDDYTFIVMDFCPDGDLFGQILHKRRYLGHDNLIKNVFLQLLDAVNYCHSLGIYHRDLKPENVLCFDGGLRLAITDFGLATTEKVSEEFRTGSVYHMSPECQGGSFAPSGTYSPPFNDIWSLGIILLNLITGRNPWKSASSSDPTFQAYLQDPVNFLPSVLPISAEVNEILLRTLDINWRNRISITELRRAIKCVSTFYADDVVFEGSMARCSWEAGIDITGGSQPEDDSFDMPQHEDDQHQQQQPQQQQEPRSGWSTDSSTDSSTDMVFAVPSRDDNSSWVPYPASGATWGADSGLRTDTPSQGSASFLTYDDQRTPSSSFSMYYSPALSGPYVSTQGDEESTFVECSDRLKPQHLSASTESDLYEESIVMRSAESATMHTALESPIAHSYFLLQSSVSVSKPTFVAPSAFEVGISSFYEDEERFRDSMSWARASTFDQRTRTESDLVNVSSMDFSPTTEPELTMIGHSPVSGKPWPDFYTVTPMPQPQVHGTRLPFPLVPLKSSPATTTPFQSPSSPPAHGRRKPRSSSFFNPIKFAFPPRHPSPIPSVPVPVPAAGRSAPASPHAFSPFASSPHPKSAFAELAHQSSPAQEHTRGRRRHRQPLRSARDWLFSSKLFAAPAA